MQIQDVRLFTVNSDHFMGQALATCGVDNIFADAPLSVAPVSLEAVIGAQPNVIVTVAQANQKTRGPKFGARICLRPVLSNSLQATSVSRLLEYWAAFRPFVTR